MLSLQNSWFTVELSLGVGPVFQCLCITQAHQAFSLSLHRPQLVASADHKVFLRKMQKEEHAGRGEKDWERK